MPDVAGKEVSTWHDVPLFLEGGALSFICEIPKETSAKMEVATVSASGGQTNFRVSQYTYSCAVRKHAMWPA